MGRKSRDGSSEATAEPQIKQFSIANFIDDYSNLKRDAEISLGKTKIKRASTAKNSPKRINRTLIKHASNSNNVGVNPPPSSLYPTSQGINGNFGAKVAKRLN
jgi:hypothetical protein